LTMPVVWRSLKRRYRIYIGFVPFIMYAHK